MSDANIKKTLGTATIEEIMIGLVLVGLATFSIQDLLVLFLYKTLNFKARSTTTALMVFIFSMLLLVSYMRMVPKEVVEGIL